MNTVSTMYASLSHGKDIDLMAVPFTDWLKENYGAVIQSPVIRHQFREVFRSTGRREWHREDRFLATHGEQVCPSTAGISMEVSIGGMTVRYEEFPDRAEMAVDTRVSIMGKDENGYSLGQSKVLFSSLLRMSLEPFSDL